LADIIRRMLKWNTMWLEEQKDQKNEPPVVDPSTMCVNKVPSVFVTYNDYCNTFYPLLLKELWAGMYQEYLEQYKERAHRAIFGIQRPPVDAQESDTRRLDLVSFLTEDERKWEFFLPMEGSLMRLELYLRPDAQRANKPSIKPVFALVHKSAINRLKPGELEQHAILVGDSRRKRFIRHTMWINVEIKTLAAHENVDFLMPHVGFAVSRVKPMLRTVQAVQDFPESPLFGSLLMPDNAREKRVFRKLSTGAADAILPEISINPMVCKLNKSQEDVVRGVALACVGNAEEPSVSLIQGPPGTGKTSTIVALVLQIIARARHLGLLKPRILLIAPSNAAVDEVSHRLVEQARDLPEELSFGLVRVGRENAVSDAMRQHRLEAQRDRRCIALVGERSNQQSMQAEVRERSKAVDQLGKQLQEHRIKGNRDQEKLIKRRMEEEIKSLRSTKDRLEAIAKEATDETLRRKAFDDVLHSADIVATTINSSMAGQMANYFIKRATCRTHRPFQICIVDEASQCIEPEGIMPLKLQFKKLVMIGDPAQLPATVSSREARAQMLHVSLFSRLFRNLEKQGNVRTLAVQYRMHPDIASFPSRYFYGNTIQNGDQKRDTCLRPYCLFNLSSSEKQEQQTVSNDDEARMVEKIVRQVVDILKQSDRPRDRTLNIGVITFYNAQVRCIRNFLQKKGISENVVKVRTVDGYQGSECDVIVISCVRSVRENEEEVEGKVNGRKISIGFLADEQRLNVALTRAKYALYVVGNFDCLRRSNKMWKSLIDDAESRGCFQDVRLSSQLKLARYRRELKT